MVNRFWAGSQGCEYAAEGFTPCPNGECLRKHDASPASCSPVMVAVDQAAREAVRTALGIDGLSEAAVGASEAMLDFHSAGVVPGFVDSSALIQWSEADWDRWRTPQRFRADALAGLVVVDPAALIIGPGVC